MNRNYFGKNNPFYGKRHSEETKAKIRKKFYNTSNNLSYWVIHERVKEKYGKPLLCEHCKRTDSKKYVWANKDHKYSMPIKRKDWIRLCSSCHRKYDIKYNKLTVFNNHKKNIEHPRGMLGKHHTDETKLKIGIASYNNPNKHIKFFSKETRKRMGEASRKRWVKYRLIHNK